MDGWMDTCMGFAERCLTNSIETFPMHYPVRDLIGFQ